MIDKIVSEILSNKPETVRPIIKVAFQLQEGGYGYGDNFCGTQIPILRTIAKKYKSISLSECETLLHNSLHEARFVALAILVFKCMYVEV